MSPRVEGRVTAFDDHTGLGTIVDGGGSEYRFHCIEIANGSRSIAVGASVTFEVLPKLGCYEAASIAA